MAITDYALVDKVKRLVADVLGKLQASYRALKKGAAQRRELVPPALGLIDDGPRVYHPDDIEVEGMEDTFSWTLDEAQLMQVDGPLTPNPDLRDTCPDAVAKSPRIRGLSDSSPLLKELKRQKIRSDSVLAAKKRMT